MGTYSLFQEYTFVFTERRGPLAKEYFMHHHTVTSQLMYIEQMCEFKRDV